METRVTEVADGVHQLTTVVPDAPVVFNQYPIVGDEPTLFPRGEHPPRFVGMQNPEGNEFDLP